MTDPLPYFAPVLLSGLTYNSAMRQARQHGLDVAREHWCGNVVFWNGRRFMMDNETDPPFPYTRAADDYHANDWFSTHPDPVAVAERAGAVS